MGKGPKTCGNYLGGQKKKKKKKGLEEDQLEN